MLDYYYSGVYAVFKQEDNDRIAPVLPHRLLSCHGPYVKYAHKWLTSATRLGDKQQTILLDSGAFSAWNLGEEVTLETLLPIYSDLLEKYLDKTKQIWLINLDKIPGSPGRTADAAEIEHCIEVSDRNYEKLVEEFGNRVLPVFHQNESEERLAKVCQMADYICVSPRNDLAEKLRVKWAEEVHRKIPSHVKTHGLAATGIEMMTKVRWGSVDSASMVFTAASGMATLLIDGKLVNLGFSLKSPARHDAGYHYCNISKEYLAKVDQRLNEIGFTAEQLAVSNKDRFLVSMFEIKGWVDKYHAFSIKEEQIYLFDL